MQNTKRNQAQMGSTSEGLLSWKLRGARGFCLDNPGRENSSKKIRACSVLPVLRKPAKHLVRKVNPYAPCSLLTTNKKWSRPCEQSLPEHPRTFTLTFISTSLSSHPKMCECPVSCSFKRVWKPEEKNTTNSPENVSTVAEQKSEIPVDEIMRMMIRPTAS